MENKSISANGILFLQGLEGCRLKPYLDDAKNTTRVEYSIGYGHQIQPGEEYLMNGITKQKANDLFKKDVLKYQDAVNKGLRVPVTQSVFDALVSFCYNIGTGAFKNSVLLGAINDKKNGTLVSTIWAKSFIRPAVLIARRAKEINFAYQITEGVKNNAPRLLMVAVAAFFF